MRAPSHALAPAAVAAALVPDPPSPILRPPPDPPTPPNPIRFLPSPRFGRSRGAVAAGWRDCGRDQRVRLARVDCAAAARLWRLAQEGYDH
eukprot:821919-Pleurochrysis_carterae.AAC.1